MDGGLRRHDGHVETAHMPSSFTLGKHFEAFVQTQLASCRYGNASEVLRDALRLMEDREILFQALDAALSRGIAT